MPQAREAHSWEDLFTAEEMETARDTDLPDLLTSLGYHVKRAGRYHTLREMERIARKYGVDYAIKRDRSSDPPRFLIFFKSRDADALTAAFNEYAGNKVKKASRPSVLQRLAHFKELVKNTVVNREKRRDLER